MTEAASCVACLGVARPLFRTLPAVVFTLDEVLGLTGPRPEDLAIVDVPFKN